MPVSTNTPAAAHFQATLKRYLELNQRNARELVAKKAKSAVIQFYKLTKETAPTPAKIKQDVLALGWRVKRKPGAWPYKKGEKRGSKGPLNRMRASVIRRRQRAIGSVASGWIPAMAALGAKSSAKDAANFPRPLGRLDIIGMGGSTPAIAVVNQTPGCVAVEAKHNITERGLNAVDDDMQTYIARKQAETAQAVQR